ncbi:MAG: STAS domain-containing protein [Pirellulales bacterium]|nr:STAS domain-containing protein [Pirellulales bacterium]
MVSLDRLLTARPRLFGVRWDQRTEEHPSMAEYRRIELTEVGEVAVVRFVDFKILDEANIQEMGQELFHLVEQDGYKKVLLNFSNVQFLSSAALGKLITLDKKVKKAGGQLKLSNILPDIYEVFAITKLNRLFDIREDEADALAAF